MRSGRGIIASHPVIAVVIRLLGLFDFMSVRFIGPTTFILAQAAAAVLCDHIARDRDEVRQEELERSGSEADGINAPVPTLQNPKLD